ncbi:MAG: hypothetical protein HOL98_04115 [Gammaproteobacteria bacterium]|jgi:hypothetical protein|nr:hypothetical protein [Gammaproteobacteria bacterium]MBT5202620.1 hypothetical protein [Gammaproteobacteria bacterium]MBT5602676.1 hypothetical protein [Gammaproteobacteria bacterium]MBT6245451.1 hypothetical protein [Gammaproteobacteria bacterium]
MIWRILNPLTIAIANSPLHFLISHSILVLKFRGVKSGKNYAIPVSYIKTDDNQVCCLTDRPNIWWRNLKNIHELDVMYRGSSVKTSITIEFENNTAIADKLGAICSHSRIDGFFAGVAYENGSPIKQDIDKAAERMTLIELHIQ